MHAKSTLTLWIALVLLAIPAVAEEVEIEWVPLDWEHAAIENGGVLFAELCAVCHGDDAKGGGPAAPALKNDLPDLTTLTARNDGEFPAPHVARTIRGESIFPAHGTREMPIWGHAFYDVRPDWKRKDRKEFVEEKVHALVAYLETIQTEN